MSQSRVGTWTRARLAVAAGCLVLTACREPARGTVDLPPGLRLEEAAAVLQQAGLASAPAFARRARDPAFARALGIPAASLEGYLAPGRHELPLPAELDDVLRLLVTTQRARVEAARGTRRAELAILTLASIAEAEARSPTELPIIAGVLARRAARGWRLASEATLAYALGLPSGTPASATAHALDHPHNTFRNPGLPPGPIASPGEAAIRAALAPAGDGELVLLHDAAGRVRQDLPDEELRALAAVPADPPPPHLTRQTHYVVSNELAHQHFRAPVLHAGGVLIGVGAEQNYLLAGWARPELVVLADFDQLIPDLHGVYEAAFRAAETPADFVALWRRPGWRRLDNLLVEALPPGRERRAARAALRYARGTVAWRLAAIMARYRELGVPTFLTDPEQYAHVAALARHGRIRRLRGDLTARGTFQGLGEALAKSGRVVRVLYLSNAEQYFPFTPQYRTNLLGLPSDARSVVLRTRPTGMDYTYVVQTYENLRPWLGDARVRDVRALAPRRRLSVERPLYEISSRPPPASRDPR